MPSERGILAEVSQLGHPIAGVRSKPAVASWFSPTWDHAVQDERLPRHAEVSYARPYWPALRASSMAYWYMKWPGPGSPRPHAPSESPGRLIHR